MMNITAMKSTRELLMWAKKTSGNRKRSIFTEADRRGDTGLIEIDLAIEMPFEDWFSARQHKEKPRLYIIS